MITSSLTFVKGKDCSDLIRFHILKKTLDENIKDGVYEQQSKLARQALQNIWPHDSPLKQSFYGYLDNFPHIRLSFSHTKLDQNLIAIAALSTDDLVGSGTIGVDLEYSLREVKEGIKKYFMIENPVGFEPLEIWVIKEAIYKFLNARKKTILLHEIRIDKNGNIYNLDRDKVLGEFGLYQWEDYLIAFACERKL